MKETKRYGRTHGQTDNVKTVYPYKVCGGGINTDLEIGISGVYLHLL